MIMRRTINTLLLILFTLAAIHLQARQKKTSKTGGTPTESGAKATKRIFQPTVYLGSSTYHSGPISKDVFNNLLKQGLTSHDSLGNRYRVAGFDFSYSERKLYEDSVGNIIPVMDLSSQYCPGDTVSRDISTTRVSFDDSSDVSRSIYERTKPGDTVYFDHIRVVRYINATQSLPDSAAISGKGMKFVITK